MGVCKISISKGSPVLDKFRYLLLFCFLIGTSFAKEDKSAPEYDFKAIKEVLKNDMLDGEADKKVKKIRAAMIRKKAFAKSKYNIPGEDEFWTFLSQYWLVQNAQLLKWDFKKPDYGIDKSFRTFLEKLGHYNVKFKVLILDSPNIFHFALPSGGGEYLFLLSLPFIRTLDLNKLEISVILYEDYFRMQEGKL